MLHRQVAVVITLLMFVIASLAGQEAIGPVTPKAPMTLDGYHKGLSTALKGDAVGKLWDKSDGPLRLDYFTTAQELSKRVPQVVIGPVTPKPIVNPKPPPAPVNPKPGPGPNPPAKPPTKKQFEDAFKDLQSALERASKANPGYRLPTESARDMQRLLDGLTIIKP
jgi:hypothetical protein